VGGGFFKASPLKTAMSSFSKWRCVFRVPGPKVLARALALAWLFFPGAIFVLAQNSRPTEPQVKAAYLYNFGKFVTWPPDRTTAADVLTICILGKDPFGEVLDSTVKGESINSKKIEVQRLPSMEDMASCNILYISPSEESHLTAILAVAQRVSLLTVSDIKHFAERGGVVGLVTQQDRIRFEVNLNAAERNHLLLSSELLKVATRVFQQKAGGG
jgi:hypothetical protein